MQCPNCGNQEWKHVQTNGCDPKDPAYGLLCLAPVATGEESYCEDQLKEFPDLRRVCSMQWDPNES
jgi:hypothetical protein